MESFADRARAFLLALLFHVVLIGLLWFSAFFVLPRDELSAAGEPIQATLMVSAADMQRAQAAVEAAPEPEPEPEPVVAEPVAPPPQPEPAPQPQLSPTPPQPLPQAPQDRPDTVDQERITRLAQEQADRLAREEQEQRRRQEQVELTEDIARQEKAEERERLRKKLEDIRRERAAAAKRTRLEEQRLQQLADMAAATPKPAPAADNPPPPGNRGDDTGLEAAYMAAMNATARANWNTSLAPELIRCRVRFTQIPGGEVINVEFINCPYDSQGRDSVERALRKTPMPYAGFEPVFSRQATLTFCYPDEACQ